ncbi:hypothetical protein RFI_25237, partial [Reticulomyxa filosa]
IDQLLFCFQDVVGLRATFKKNKVYTKTSLKNYFKEVVRARFSPNGLFIISCSSDGTIRIWDSITGNQLKILQGHTNWVRDVRISPDGQTIISCSDDKTIRLWDIHSDSQLQRLVGHFDWVRGPDGKTFVSGPNDKTIRLWG